MERKPAKKVAKNKANKPVPKKGSNPRHKEAFNQLLSDAVFGVRKK
ncbi:hypothetical protein [Sulfuricaulis limicola]|nr:hypothetical protein [Sulfuricaulis limicola]